MKGRALLGCILIVIFLMIMIIVIMVYQAYALEAAMLVPWIV